MRRISYRISMLKRMIVAGAALAMFLLPAFTPDARASDSRWYVGLSVPVMFLDDSESVTSGTNVTPMGDISYEANAVNSYKAGFKVSGMLGYEFGNGFRIEGEAFFARANLSKLTYSGITSPALPDGAVPAKALPVSGLADQLGGMVNVWYDFNTGSRWRPFIGGGLGVVQVDWGGVEYDTNGLAQAVADQLAIGRALQQSSGQPQAAVDAAVAAALAGAKLPDNYVPKPSGTDTVLGYKVGAGLGYELTDAIIVQVSYRFFRTNQLEFNGRNAIGNTVKATTDLQAHLFEVGLRYRF